jgi:integrase
VASLTDLRKTPKGYTGKKPWQIRYRDHAKQQRSEQFTRKGDAESRLREVQTAEETGRIDLLDSGTATLSEVGVQFFNLHKNEWGEGTAEGHAYVWNAAVEGESKHPRATIADMAVRNIRKSHVTAWRNDALAAGVAISTVRRVQSLMTRTLDFAADEDMIGANPAARVKPPKEPGRQKPKIITPDLVEAIRAEMVERDAVFVSILAYTGLRPHEARALTIEQFDSKELHLERACGTDGSLQPLKSGHEMRDVPVCDAVVCDVEAGEFGKGWMFPNLHSRPMTKTDYDNWRKRRFYPAVKKANAKIVKAAKQAGDGNPALIPDGFIPYDLRHSIASLWYRQGIDKATIATWLGHSIPVLERDYAWHFKTLDPLDRRTADEMIADARAALAEAK